MKDLRVIDEVQLIQECCIENVLKNEKKNIFWLIEKCKNLVNFIKVTFIIKPSKCLIDKTFCEIKFIGC